MPTLRLVAALTIAALPASMAAQRGPDAAEVLRAAAEYVSAYAPRVSGVTLEETYTLRDVSGGYIRATTRITSDVILLNLAGEVIVMRDPYAIDERPLRERTPRITTLLAEPSAAAWAKAQEYTAESLRYFEDPLIVRLNEPTLALRFIAPEHQAKSTFRIDGRRRFGDVQTVALRFQETKRPEGDYVVDTPGKALGWGRLWVDPATGRIHRTELTMQSAEETVRISVEYSHDRALDLWLPSSMMETYEITERVGGSISNMGAGTPGTARRSFETRSTYTNPRHTPIELSVRK
jgi:hypothetical protein